MTARSIRRANARKTQKKTRKEAVRQQEAHTQSAATEATTFEVTDPLSTEDFAGHAAEYNGQPHSCPEVPDFTIPAVGAAAAAPALDRPETSSESQRTANRLNARLSTGPRSASGKARASLNAVKTGLTGRTVLLPTDDLVAYETHLQRFFTAFKPTGDRETELVQRLTDSQWRLYRIPEIEAGIYALARIQFAEEFADYSAAESAALIQAQAFLTYQKQLNNLSIQESRLHRQFDRDLKELQQIQGLRRQIEVRAAAQKRPTLSNPQTSDQQNGFVFSNSCQPAVAGVAKAPVRDGIDGQSPSENSRHAA